MTSTETTYRSFLIEKITHAKLADYWGVFENTGKHVYNCKSLQQAKRLCDSIIDKGIHSELNIEWKLLHPPVEIESNNCDGCGQPMINSNIHGWSCNNKTCQYSPKNERLY